MAENQNKPSREYDVALSFAGEDREYVEAVASSLQQAGVSVYYDRYEEAVLPPRSQWLVVFLRRQLLGFLRSPLRG
jgi:TIR domain